MATEIVVKTVAKSLKYIRSDSKSLDNSGVFGILYAKEIPLSHPVAQSYIGPFIEALRDHNVPLKVSLISAEELESVKNLNYLYVPPVLSTLYQSLSLVADEKKIMTLGEKKECSIKRCCVLAFDYENGLEIYLNQKSLRSRGFGLRGAFRFMVKRI